MTGSRSPGRQATSTAGWLLASALAGVLQSLCFDATPSRLLPWVAWTPTVALALWRGLSLVQALLCAWTSGVVFWLITVGWISHSVGTHGGLGMVLGWLVVGLLAAYMGLYWVGFVALARALRPSAERFSIRIWTIWLVGIGASWVVLEIVREELFTGFPWTPLGESLVSFPGALESSAWLGVRGLSFWVLVVNAAIAIAVLGCLPGIAVRTGMPRSGRWSLPCLAAALLTVIGMSFAERLAPVIDATGERERRTVRLVQPNLPINPPAQIANEAYAKLQELSRCARPGTLIVWPESAAFPRLWQGSRQLREDVRAITNAGCELLFSNSWVVELEDGERGFTNSALLADSRAETLQRYDKVHLVPYGEYVPLRELLPFVNQLARSVGEFEAGEEANLLSWRGIPIGLSICFEVLFPVEVSARVRAGAEVLAVLTNDAWFGRSRAPSQHLVSAQFRAAESRRPLLFAAVTGHSAVIDVRGDVHERLGLDLDGAIEVELGSLGWDPTAAVTTYSRSPRTVDLLAVGALVLAAILRRYS